VVIFEKKKSDAIKDLNMNVLSIYTSRN